jgi:hypothetical protein
VGDSEILYFKVYKSQLQVVEKALGIAALMLGRTNPVVTVRRRKSSIGSEEGDAQSSIFNLRQKRPRLKLPLAEYHALRNQVLKRDS